MYGFNPCTTAKPRIKISEMNYQNKIDFNRQEMIIKNPSLYIARNQYSGSIVISATKSERSQEEE